MSGAHYNDQNDHFSVSFNMYENLEFSKICPVELNVLFYRF